MGLGSIRPERWVPRTGSCVLSSITVTALLLWRRGGLIMFCFNKTKYLITKYLEVSRTAFYINPTIPSSQPRPRLEPRFSTHRLKETLRQRPVLLERPSPFLRPALRVRHRQPIVHHPLVPSHARAGHGRDASRDVQRGAHQVRRQVPGKIVRNGARGSRRSSTRA